MARLAAALAVTAFAPLGPLKIRAVAGGGLGGVARAADDPLQQAGHDNQSGSGMPTIRTPSSSSLCLRYKRESGRHQGFSSDVKFAGGARHQSDYPSKPL